MKFPEFRADRSTASNAQYLARWLRRELTGQTRFPGWQQQPKFFLLAYRKWLNAQGWHLYTGKSATGLTAEALDPQNLLLFLVTKRLEG